VIVFHPHMPATVVMLLHADNGVAQLQIEGRMLVQRLHQFARQETEIHIRAVLDPRRGNRLFCTAAPHHQRHPFAQHCVIFAVFHLIKQMVLAHCRIAFAQKFHIILTPHETLMTNRVDELLGRRQHAVSNQICPILQRHLERGIDLQRALDRHCAIGLLRRVVQFAVPCMPRTGIVQAVRTFLCHLAQAFDHHDFQRGVQLRQ
jgi:hypothetical protein